MAGTVTGESGGKVVESNSRRNGVIVLVGLLALAVAVVGVTVMMLNSSQPPVVPGATPTATASALPVPTDTAVPTFTPGATTLSGPHVRGITAGVGMRSGEVSGPVPVAVTFSEAMDEASAQSAFSISPAADGSFKWQGNTLVFTPGAPLNPNTAYTVTLAKNAKTKSGGTL